MSPIQSSFGHVTPVKDITFRPEKQSAKILVRKQYRSEALPLSFLKTSLFCYGELGMDDVYQFSHFKDTSC